jgi:hypothetical protein
MNTSAKFRAHTITILFIIVPIGSGRDPVDRKMAGIWIAEVQGPKITGHPPIYFDPALNKEALKRARGYETRVLTLNLRPNQRFDFDPISVFGTWHFDGKIVVLTPKTKNALDYLNDYSTSSTNGRPDLTLNYRAKDGSLQWIFGNKKYGTRKIIYFHRQMHKLR